MWQGAPAVLTPIRLARTDARTKENSKPCHIAAVERGYASRQGLEQR